MRLDLFLPYLRRPKKHEQAPRPGWLIRALSAPVPKGLLSDFGEARYGPFRRWLKKLGPTWLSSPVRRVVQALCLTAFLLFFFWTCWPYDAVPDAISRAAAATAVAGPADDPTGGGEAPGAPDASGADLAEAVAERWPDHYARNLAAKEVVETELFLAIDPLVSISTAIAGKTWVWSLAFAAGILLLCVVFPRGFCGYLCPLGTLIDLFDWAVGKRVTRFQVKGDGWWVHLKYYILLGCLVAAMGGVLLTGFVAAIPVVTRGLLFTLNPLQIGLMRGWHQVPPLNAGHLVSIVLFFVVLALGFYRPRFWCRYVCPTGAVFSVGNLFRASERKVESTCIKCNKCVEICPFDAIKADFTTRTADCTLCQTCGGVCPSHSIKFVDRWDVTKLKTEDDPPTREVPLSRRGFRGAPLAAVAAVLGIQKAWGAGLGGPAPVLPVRPPGSVPEQEFLQLCIRCGECFKACPNNVLQPMGFRQGLEGLWTPEVVANWSGCEPSCNACGQVCPTGAIRALPLEEKRVARMGLAIVNESTCLPYAGKEACQMCVDECQAAGYNAIEFLRVRVEVDEEGLPVEDSGYLAPVVLADRCVGCGLCQTRCHKINVEAKHLLASTAIWVEPGRGKEDRLLSGSYRDLRAGEARIREEKQKRQLEESGASDSYLPDFLK